MQLSPIAANHVTSIPERSTTSSPPSESVDAGTLCCDDRVITRLRELVHAIARAPHLREEREDFTQEALICFWETMCRRPGQPLLWYLGKCRFFIRDRLKHGRSVDSPKRRRFGHSIDCNNGADAHQSITELVSESNPAEDAHISDALQQIYRRLTAREQTILRLFLQGYGTREVARQLRLSASVITDSSLRIRSTAVRFGLHPIGRHGQKKNRTRHFLPNAKP